MLEHMTVRWLELKILLLPLNAWQMAKLDGLETILDFLNSLYSLI